jgi:hypothetical protein
MLFKRLKDYMPKFYCGKDNGFEYHSSGVGWRKIPLLNLFPYLTGDVIRIRISLTPLFEGMEWQTGIVEVEPPELSRENPQIRLSDAVFSLIDSSEWPKGASTAPMYKFSIGTRWTRVIALKSGLDFFQPCHIKCTLVLQNILGNKYTQSASMPIADIEVISRPSFYMRILTTTLAVIAIVISVIAIITRN